MTFLGPWFLMGVLGVAGAAIPIVLHFFFRSRYRTVPWAAMEFLLTSIEQTSRRLKFQELLLLILRCALLLLLALALARPAYSLVGLSSSRDAVDAVFVIDNSFSMGAREGARTRFELAKAAALNAIDQMPPHSTVQIFTCGTAVSSPLLRETANLDQARKLIDNLQLTHQATDLSKGLAEAVKTLQNSRVGNKELYVFSDMQKQGLDQNASEVTALLGSLKTSATIYLVRCGTRTLANAAILDVVAQTGTPRPGHRVGFAVVVRNTSSLPVRQLQVGLAVDGAQDGADMQTIAELPPGEKQVVTLSARFEKPGLHVVTGFLGADDLPGDNYLDRVVLVRDKVRVLVVDGNLNLREPSQASSYFLVNALTPVPEDKKADYFLQAEVITPRQAGGELLKDKAICILANVPLPGNAQTDAETPTKEFIDTLGDFVRQGGGLMIYGGDKVSAKAYNNALAGLLPVGLTETEAFPIAVAAKGSKEIKDANALDRSSAALPAFDHFRTDQNYDKLGVFPILKSLGLQEPGVSGQAKPGSGDVENARVIFRYTNGKPAIVTRKVGLGEVMLIGTSADPGFKPRSQEPTWTWLPLWGQGYVPLVEAKVNYLLNGQLQNHNASVGEALSFSPSAETALRSFLLVTPSERTGGKGALVEGGERVPLGPATKDSSDRPLVVTPALLRAGVYWLTTRDNDLADRIPFAVAADLRESADLETLSDKDIDRLVGFAPVHIAAKEEEAAVFASERTNREWTSAVLWVVLAVAVGESLLAWFCGRGW
jgi:hypothetical protein